MKPYRIAFVVLLALLVAGPAVAQERVAPNITGMAVQGTSVNLEYYKGEKNILIVFYRMHN